MTKTIWNKEPKEKKIKPKKVKKKTRWQLIKELDTLFSRYIRQKNSINWMCKCITCWKLYQIKEIQNWHFITRWNYKYRRDEINCHPQCVVCNIFLRWNYIAYTLRMINKYWKEKVEEMQNDKELVKISTSRIYEMIDFYKSKLK